MPGQELLGTHQPYLLSRVIVSHTGDMSRGEEREPGEVEQGVLKDLSRLPEDLRVGGIAQVALYAARQLDGLGNAFDLPARDAAAFLAQIRHCVTQLRDWAPGEVKDDVTDTAQKRRESRMLRAVPDGKY
jgi:hypothetical protein